MQRMRLLIVTFAAIVAVAAFVWKDDVRWELVAAACVVAFLLAAWRSRVGLLSKVKSLTEKVDRCSILEREQFDRQVNAVKDATLGGDEIGRRLLQGRARDLNDELQSRKRSSSDVVEEGERERQSLKQA